MIWVDVFYPQVLLTAGSPVSLCQLTAAQAISLPPVREERGGLQKGVRWKVRRHQRHLILLPLPLPLPLCSCASAFNITLAGE